MDLLLGRQSDVNPNAAETRLKRELLREGPYCVSTAGAQLPCSPNATRTQRAGIHELAYLGREDRSYCSYDFVREALTPEANDTESCRATLQDHIAHCKLE